ncbi:hypothetical protein CU086_00445 [Candidatus Nasuia deltocephalinicola]|uniref:Uncharacterized protein n=1 Tax=Candidatus Nasuia deltocephalincola TaxID=1160784 RepID=A0A974WKM4_9PROT|nr:hypothetical protein CU086_00445 [Candidatus Nasuia deltocephalinicola]
MNFKIFKKKNKIKKLASGHYIFIKNLKYNFIKNSIDKIKNQNYFVKKIIFEKNIIFLLGKNYKINLIKIFLKKINIIKILKSSKGICFINNKNLKIFLNFYIYKKITFKKYLLKKRIYKFLKFNKKNKNFNNLFLLIKNNYNFFKKKKYLKCKINNSKYFLICIIKKIKKIILLIFNKKINILKGQNISLYYKNFLISNSILI